MIKLIGYELHKMWSKKSFLFFALVLLLINFLLLFINEQTGANSHAGAYRQLTSELSGLTMTEKQARIDDLYRCIDGINMIDQILRFEMMGTSEYSKALRQENAKVFQEFLVVYRTGGYLCYTDNLYQEYYFLKSIKDEIDKVSGYSEYLDNIQKKAENLSQISIFKSEDGNSYSEQCIRAEAAAYEHMRGIETDYLPEKGIMSALDFRLSDVILIAFVLLMASTLLREEKDNGMLELGFTTPGGRIRTAIAKLTAVFISLFAVVAVIYCLNLVFYHNLYGISDLSRSVQSLPSLVQCTWQVSIGGYLLLFMLAKWIAAAVVGGWLMLCTYLAKNIFIGWGAGLVFIGINYLIRIGVSPVGYWNLLRYVNIFSLMNTNEVLGRYIQLYFFGRPVPILLAEGVAGIVFVVLFIWAFLAAYQKGIAVYQKRSQFALVRAERVRTKYRHRPLDVSQRISRHELYKLLVMNGAVFVFLAFALFLIFQTGRGSVYISIKENVYQSYMIRWGGRFTQATLDDMVIENEQFKPLYDLEDALYMGILSSQQYGELIQQYQGLQTQKEVFDNIISNKSSYLKAHPKAWIVYDTGYKKLFDAGGNEDAYEMMILFLILILGFSSMFSVEKMTGMTGVLATTALGQRDLAGVKLRLACRIAALLAFASLIPRYITIGRHYGFEQLLAPAQSLEIFSGVPPRISILAMLVLQIIVRMLIAMTAVCLVLALSLRSGNTLVTLFTAALILELGPLLYLCGVKPLVWISLWPAFHFPGILAGGASILLLFLYGIISLGLFWGTRDYLLRSFGAPSGERKPIYSGKKRQDTGRRAVQ